MPTDNSTARPSASTTGYVPEIGFLNESLVR